MGIYEEFGGTQFATDLLSALGGPATLVRVNKAYDEASDSVTESTQVISIFAYLQGPVDSNDNGAKVVNATLISNTALASGDRVILQGKTYVIGSQVDSVAPDGRALVWKAKVAK